MTPLERIAEVIRGITFSKTDGTSEPKDGSLPVIRAGSIQQSLLLDKDQIWVPSNKIRPHQFIRKNDIVMCTSSGSSDLVGKCAKSEQDWNGSFGAFCAGIRADDSKCDSSYLYHFLCSPQFRNWSKASGGANIKNIRASELAVFEIPLPSLTEQKRIATILDKADSLRRKNQQAIQLADQFLRAVFLDLFGDPVTNPREWNKRQLEDICLQVIDCPHSTPEWTNAGVIGLRTSNLTKGGWNWDDKRFVSEETYEERTKRAELKANDIILSREGTVGVAALVPADMRMCMGQRLVQLRVNTDILTSEYMLFLLLYELEPERLSKVMTGSTSKHLNVKDLRKLSVAIPPIEKQQSFSKIFTKIKISEVHNNFGESYSQELFSSLSQKAFAGEL